MPVTGLQSHYNQECLYSKIRLPPLNRPPNNVLASIVSDNWAHRTDIDTFGASELGDRIDVIRQRLMDYKHSTL